MTIDINALYSRKQVEEILGVKEEVIARLIKNGELNPKKIGRKYIFMGKDILAFLEAK